MSPGCVLWPITPSRTGTSSSQMDNIVAYFIDAYANITADNMHDAVRFYIIAEIISSDFPSTSLITCLNTTDNYAKLLF